MQKFGDFICKHTKNVMIITCILLVLSVIGMSLTNVNYDILVYLPKDIETIKGQDILTDDFNMGSYSIATIKNAKNKDILKLEEKIKTIDGVNEVISIYDVLGSTTPLEMLPNDIQEKAHKDNTDMMFITFEESTSAKRTLDAVDEIREITDESLKLGGMSSMVKDTMNLSNKELAIYVIIAVVLCLVVLELSLDSFIVPILLLLNIGVAILFNLGSNIFLGEISYITKALVAVLQLGVTTDFSIFLYHSYEKNKKEKAAKEKAMTNAIKETFTSVTGSSLTTIAGFLVLATMNLTLGKDLGFVMAKGVLLGVISVLTIFPSLLLLCDKWIEKTRHQVLIPKFTALNNFIIKHHIAIFACFLLLIYPAYLANKNVDVYYKMDKSLPDTLESIMTNEELKTKFNIVSPEIILLNKDLANDDVENLVKELENTAGIDFVLSYSKIKNMGITENMLSEDIVGIFEQGQYQMLMLNSLYDIATDELNEQVVVVNDIVKKYDKDAIVAGEGPLMKDLIEISDKDFKNVNYSSIICIFLILFIVLKSLSLPILLISAIEFAIFTNMGISYFGGTVLPFVAPIVLGTIQLGATIDYAILITTTYLTHRKDGIPKKEAMQETLKTCDNSIFVSGMCFFAATFGVGIYSKLEMVGSLCTLISRGAIISMLVVITVLPSILLIFDGIIINTTLGIRKEKNMKNTKNNKKTKLAFITLGMSLTLAFAPLNTLALSKDETVYTKLNYDGSIKTVLVNEQLINNQKLESLEDYSDLENILNIHNDNGFKRDGNKLLWDARGKDIYYQGTINKTLPFKVDISYKLDGKEIELEDMIGKKGDVMITFKYKNLDAHKVYVNGRSETLYTPFTTVLATSIDTENNSNIHIRNGKTISNGTKTFLIGVATPGLYESLKLEDLKESDTITITYETEKFELPSIFSTVTPKIIESDDLKVFDKLNTIYGKMDDLQKNMDKLEEGSKAVKNGSNELKTALEKSLATMSNQTGNNNALDEKTIQSIVDMATSSVKSTFTEEYKNQIANNTWKEVSTSINGNDPEAVKIVTDSVTKTIIEYLKSVNEHEDYINCEKGKQIVSMGGVMSEQEMNSCQVIANDLTLPLIKKAATSSATLTASNTSSYVAEKVSKNVSVTIAEKVALETSSQVASTLAPLLAEEVKNASIKTISSSMNTLYKGVETLDKGINDLSTGISTYNKEGITKLSDMVQSDLKSTANRMEALVKLGEEYETFAEKNNQIDGETKFILVLDSKKAPKEEIATSQKEEKITFIDRIKNLFK